MNEQWHDLRGELSRAGEGAQYLLEQIGDDFDEWLDDGSAVGDEGDISGEDEGFEDMDGYRLTI